MPSRPVLPLLSMASVSPAPQLGNQYRDDHVLRSFLRRALPPEVLMRIEPELSELGDLAGHELYERQLAERRNEPVLTQWDPWGNRIDRIELTPLWRDAEALAVRFGLTAIPYEQRDGRYSRIHQLALVHLFHPSTDVYTCPLAMTDGAARTLLDSGNAALVERAVPRLTSRDPERFWTSGQWMTELTGGSDVGASLHRAPSGRTTAGACSARSGSPRPPSAPMALTLARPGSNPPGGARPGDVLRRDPRRGALERHPHRPAQGQARHPQGADRRADPRRPPAVPVGD